MNKELLKAAVNTVKDDLHKAVIASDKFVSYGKFLIREKVPDETIVFEHLEFVFTAKDFKDMAEAVRGG